MGRRAELALSKIKTPCSQAGDLAWIPAGGGGILTYHTVAGQGGSNTRHSVQLFNHPERVSWPFQSKSLMERLCSEAAKAVRITEGLLSQGSSL